LLQVTGGGETFVTVVRISIASQCSIWSSFVQGWSIFRE
jgi:hypothetical protein